MQNILHGCIFLLVTGSLKVFATDYSLSSSSSVTGIGFRELSAELWSSRKQFLIRILQLKSFEITPSLLKAPNYWELIYYHVLTSKHDGSLRLKK